MLFRSHGLQPTRLLLPWDFPGKSTGVGCHCLLHRNNIDGPKWHHASCLVKLDKYYMLSLLCGDLKTKTSKYMQQNRSRSKDIKNKLVVTSSEREVGRGNISLGH